MFVKICFTIPSIKCGQAQHHPRLKNHPKPAPNLSFEKHPNSWCLSNLHVLLIYRFNLDLLTLFKTSSFYFHHWNFKCPPLELPATIFSTTFVLLSFLLHGFLLNSFHLLRFFPPSPQLQASTSSTINDKVEVEKEKKVDFQMVTKLPPILYQTSSFHFQNLHHLDFFNPLPNIQLKLMISLH